MTNFLLISDIVLVERLLICEDCVWGKAQRDTSDMTLDGFLEVERYPLVDS
jgi:hypothetical protein